RAVHEGGWRVKMDEWGVPRFFNPLGAPMPEVPGSEAPAQRTASDHGLARWHGGREIRVWPGTTVWQGERIDWSWAVSYFWSGGKEH
ncbi:MAG: hypothetical protein OXK77_04285, partial [Gemmatimonadota bacterium]|nr:hypothetical protein [Gemmatimonadota bacterium]MDE2866275.1 hypothetical protein [Gemmatimonadota bacterium]